MEMRKTLLKIGMLAVTLATLSACISQTEIGNGVNDFNRVAQDITVYESPT